jgi:thiol-disulfide isomerase/thioredoxin
MKLTKFYPVAILFLFVVSQNTIGQKLYNIEVKFAGTDVSKKNIGVQVIQGFRAIPLKKDSTNIIAEVIEFPEKYPVVEINYFSSKHPPSIHRYFLTKQNCKIIVRYDKETDNINVEQASGMLSFEDGGLREFEQFAKTEIETRDAYAKLYNYDLVDSIVQSNYNDYSDAVDEKGIQFIKKYPALLYSTWIFMYEILGDPKFSKEELLGLYNKSLKSIHKGTFEEKLILEWLDPNRLALNTQAPSLNKKFKDLQGADYTISSFGGKLVLVNIWATWCGPCVAEIPRIKEIHTKYKDSLEILSFSTDANEKKLRNFIKTNEINWVNVFNQPEICRAFGSEMGVPQLVLLNEKGVIIYSSSGSEDWDLELLDKTLAFHTEKQKSNN